MGTLSKEQKLEMLSKAIDAGFEIEVTKWHFDSMDEINEAIDLFPKLSVQFRASRAKDDAWVKINRSNYPHDDKFTATMFFK